MLSSSKSFVFQLNQYLAVIPLLSEQQTVNKYDNIIPWTVRQY